jgi:hypothetical protein
MVETWQVVSAAATLLVTVFTVYGGLIKRNYDTVTLLKQRLLGTEGDETDDGHLKETHRKLDCISKKMDDHHEGVQTDLMENQRHVNQLDRKVSRVEYKVDAVAEVVEDEYDVFFRGGDNVPDGGIPAENTPVQRPEGPQRDDRGDEDERATRR